MAVTGEPVRLLCVEKGCRTPDAHRAVVGGGGHESRDGRVPAHTVDGARVAR